MADWFNPVEGGLRKSGGGDMPAPWYVISRAELDAAQSIPRRYRKANGTNDGVLEMSQAEKDAVDTANTLEQRDNTLANEIDDLEQITRALALAVLDEVNVLRGGSYGSMYAVELSADQSLPNGVFTQLDALTGATAGASSDDITVDTGSGEIETGAAGDYKIDYSVTFSGENNVTYDFAVFGGNQRSDGTLVRRALGSGGDVGVVAGSVIVNIPAPNINISIRGAHTSGSSRNVLIRNISLSVARVGSAPRTIQQLRTVISNKFGS